MQLTGGGAAAPAASGKGKKPAAAAAASVDLDEEWVVEHARQVARMLPGGESWVAQVHVKHCFG